VLTPSIAEGADEALALTQLVMADAQAAASQRGTSVQHQCTSVCCGDH
jgi:hypothetical protein